MPSTGSTHQGRFAWYFTVKAAKEMKAEQFPGHVAPRFIHQMAQSENLLPFHTRRSPCADCYPGQLATRTAFGKLFDETAIRRMGLIQSARRFLGINAKLQTVGQGKSLQQRIDERGKLVKQVFGERAISCSPAPAVSIFAPPAFRLRGAEPRG